MTTAETDRLRRHQELGRFLRAKRERVTPETLGIFVSRRRRARGLLREEVASSAGVSLTWYTWLEQARPLNPSARVLDGLARTLQLNDVERRHLYRLARPDLYTSNPSPITEQLAPQLQSLLTGLAPHAAYAINARWDVIAWNEPAERLFGGFAHLQREERNILHRLLLDPVWRELFVDCDGIVESAVAQFRAMTAHLAASPQIAELIATLSERSAAFRVLWAGHEVEQPPLCQKILNHPAAGRLVLNYATFNPDSAPPDVRFTIYTPADAASAAGVRKVCSP
jgi:transcriptional regulator with XRE-family HTH domain